MIQTQAAASMDLEEAAAFLGVHPTTLQGMAKCGRVPGAKIGRAWRFLDIDLIEYMRSQYPPPYIQPQDFKSNGYTRGTRAKSGASSYATVEEEYAALLNRGLGRKPRSTTANSVKG